MLKFKRILYYFQKRFTARTQEASVLVLTIAVMLLFSGQVLMMGLITTKSLTESGGLGAIQMAAREEAVTAMNDFELEELYPAYMRLVRTARDNTATFTPVAGGNLLCRYGRVACPVGSPDAVGHAWIRTTPVQNVTGVNWSTYRNRVWDDVANEWRPSDFTCDVWLEVRQLPDLTDEWPFTIVARVRGRGIDQILRRQTRIIPRGFSDL